MDCSAPSDALSDSHLFIYHRSNLEYQPCQFVITFYLLEIQKNLGGGEDPFLSELIRGNPQTGSYFYNRRFSPRTLSSWTPLQ